MKTKKTIGILSLFCAIGLTGCLNDDRNPADGVNRTYALKEVLSKQWMGN